MTKVKVKGAFLSKPLERSRAAEEEDDDDDEEDEDEEEAEGGNFMPFVRVENKRKRGPRGAGRHRKPLGLQNEGFSDSAQGTSSSQRSDDDEEEVGDSAQNHGDDHGGAGHGFVESTGMDAPRRGSVRLKVKPSKFREDRSQSHAMAEGTSSLKKRTSGSSDEPSSSKRHAFARDYTSPDRQQEYLTDELKTALMVVRKIMKMEAAEPFNIPVDPVALGIPDYFDIVKRPMDLGTVCKNLERGGKYRSSRDVYEDVQLVWTNCRIYNQKGDPILELLARVKKNFMKYWTAAGLYTEKSPATFKFQGRSPDAVQSEFGGPSNKKRDMREDVDIGRNKVAKIVKEADSPANSTAKRSGSSEQGVIESKATKLRPDEIAAGLHREQEAASRILNDDLDTYFLNREGPKIISVYKAHKKKKQEQQDIISKEHPVQAGQLKGPEQEAEQKSWGPGNSAVKKHTSADKPQRKKDADSHATPSKSRRVSGTGHHKADCSCVVCTGVRRKLAREGKLGNPTNATSSTTTPVTTTAATATAEAAAATPITQERIFVRLKTEANSDGPKSATGAGSGVRSGQVTKEKRESSKAKEVKRERASAFALEENNVPLKKVKVDEGGAVFRDAVPGGCAGTDGAMKAQDNTLAQKEDGKRKDAVKEEAMPEQNKDNSLSEVKLESANAVIEEGSKGAPAEETEDKEDAVQNDEHFADMLDAEADRQEGGVRYYRASYEMPLRKINPSILQMGQRLFGSASPWNSGRSLGSQSAKGYSENPILTTVSVLLRNKGT